MEIVRSWFFFILTLAPQSVVGPHWTFGYSGYILAGSPILLQTASWGGVYLLSFMFAFLGMIIVRLYTSPRFIVGVVFITILLYIPTPNQNNQRHSSTMRITAIKTMESSYFSTTNIDLNKKLQRIARIISQTPRDTDLIVLPEDSRFLKLYPKNLLHSLPITQNTFILGSARFDRPMQPALSRVMTYSLATGIQKQYTKLLVVPEGEYLSLFYQGLFTLVGLKKDVEKFARYKEYARGRNIIATHLGTTTAAVSLCSEIYSPLIQSSLAKDSGVIITLSSQSRFHGSDILYRQIVAMSKVRAVENNRYLVQAFNFGNAFFISNTGKLIAKTKTKTHFGSVTYDTPLIYTHSFFSRYPYMVPFLSVLIILFSILFNSKIKSRYSRYTKI